ncbi:MAG: hypothetical protein CMJ83_17290 [Planctomycetes bacterium]|nr:hypothetical protein [Planctomycetota bacterium]
MAIGVLLAAGTPIAAQVNLDWGPIKYSSCTPNDPVSKLQKRIDTGILKLQFDEKHGYLRSVLSALDISESSQMLVFSKTSHQLHRISPWSARALYFNDHTYVGWVDNGDVIEASSMDPERGAMFFTLRQEKTARPKFVRDKGQCLSCHASAHTQGVPGYIVRSVYPSPSGQPHYGAGTFNTDHSSPLRERWGGWYVTGTHGKQRHMGNEVATDRDNPKLDVESGANVTDLSKRTRTQSHLTKHSDIVALMVLEHQAAMHNFITYASYETRVSLFQCAEMNRVFERPADHVSDSTKRRIRRASDKLLKYLLFSDEEPLSDRIQGTSSFAKEFSARGLRDRKGRSLRDFDLERRLFKYPCSYLINSDAFRLLPAQVKDHVYKRLWEILTGRDDSGDFALLSRADREAILAILTDTHEGLPGYWKSGK